MHKRQAGDLRVEECERIRNVLGKKAAGHLLILSFVPTYKDEPSAHGRCELEARRSVHPERMPVGALTSIWQVGVPPAKAQGVDSANSLFYKKVRSNISHGFTYKDEPSAHGRCELGARRSVHPERM